MIGTQMNPHDKTSTHPDKCIGNVTLDLKRLYQSMPKHLQKKVSCHDLKLICDAYNGGQPPVDNQFVADGCEKFGHWPEEPANPTCSNTTHKFSHCDCKEPAPAPEETQDGATMSEWYGGLSKIESTEPDPEWQEVWIWGSDIPSRLVGWPEIATDFYSDEIEALKKNQK